MKAILVLDEMPMTDCAECPLCVWGIGGWACCPTRKDIEDEGKPTWCPLRPLPERKEMPKNYANRDYTQGIVDGWNSCWDEVTGVIWD